MSLVFDTVLLVFDAVLALPSIMAVAFDVILTTLSVMAFEFVSMTLTFDAIPPAFSAMLIALSSAVWAWAAPEASNNEVAPTTAAPRIMDLKQPRASPEVRAGRDTLDVSILSDGEIEATLPLNFVKRPPNAREILRWFMECLYFQANFLLAG